MTDATRSPTTATRSGRESVDKALLQRQHSVGVWPLSQGSDVSSKLRERLSDAQDSDCGIILHSDWSRVRQCCRKENVVPLTPPQTETDLIVELFGYYESPTVAPPSVIDAVTKVGTGLLKDNYDEIMESLYDVAPLPIDITTDFTDQLKELHENRPELTIPLGIGLLSVGTYFSQSLLQNYGEALNVNSVTLPIPAYTTVIIPSTTSSVWWPRIPLELTIIPKITFYEDPTKSTSGTINIGLQY